MKLAVVLYIATYLLCGASAAVAAAFLPFWTGLLAISLMAAGFICWHHARVQEGA